MDLYGEIILDHFKNPRQSGLIEGASIVGEDLNPLCGDKVRTSLKISPEGIIEEFGFLADGCAISIASTSILGENIVGMSLTDLENLEESKLYEMVVVPISPGRVKCALLGLSCLKKSIKIYNAQKERN